jgi:hypothetical protein
LTNSHDADGDGSMLDDDTGTVVDENNKDNKGLSGMLGGLF